MRAIGLVGLFGVSCLLSACSGEQQGSGQAAASGNGSVIENAVDKVSDIVVQGTAGDGWAVEEAASSIDGKVLSAKRTFQPDNQTTFVADVQCIPATGAVSVAIESYLGDVSEPSPGSEFSRTAEQNLMGGVNIVPLGRVKPNGHKVRDLSGMFSISEAASNRIELRRPPIIEIFGESVVNVPDELRQKLNTDDVNYARVVSDMLPLSVEVNNGSGKHEVIIDPAPQVAQVLAQCGGTGDVVKPEGVARIQAAEEAEKKADEEARLQEEQRLAARQAETDAFNKDLCRNRGSHPMYKAMCESKFPDDYAAYQQDIDQIVADAKSKRCKLDRIAVEDNASRNGVASERERIAAMDKCSWLN